MTFSLLQISVTFVSFLTTVFFAYLWYKRDGKKHYEKNTKRDTFGTLMAVFMYSAVFTLLYKMMIDASIILFPSLQTFFGLESLIVFGEELVKATALIIGMNIADERFDELSDGIIYAAFSVLGFLFTENIFYLLSTNPSIQEYTLTLFGRLIFSYGAHMATAFFGIIYAAAYLNIQPEIISHMKQKKIRCIPPYDILGILREIQKKYAPLSLIYILLSPFMLILQIRRQEHFIITLPEMLVSGILLSAYIHIGYNILLSYNNPLINSITLALSGMFGLFLYHVFPSINIRPQIKE